MNQQQTHTISIRLHTSNPEKRPIYIAGNFNKWDPGDRQYQLREVSPGNYQVDIPLHADISFPVEYKYHRGGWANVELTKYGQRAPNRVIHKVSSLHIHDEVPHWRVDGLHYKERYLPVVEIVSEAFEIPQLIRTRRVSVLLPHDYHQTKKRYPVLYLQDGQNLFDDYAPFGNWGVDKTLAVLAEQGIGDIIVVAIDHAAEQRIEEYNPTSTHPKLGPGLGKKYARFLTDTLKPYVDKNFRTLSDRSHTGIGGSSMGGLISIYAGLIYPEIYGKLLIFSPALWVAPNIHFHALNFHGAFDMDIYLYAGANEGASMIPNVKRFKQALEQQGLKGNKIEFNLAIDPEGQHNEARWGIEFPSAIEWLYFR